MASRTLLPDLVDNEKLLWLNGVLHSWGGVDNLVEAALAGVIIKLWGLIFLIDAVTYFVGAVSPLFIWRLKTRAHGPSERWRPLAQGDRLAPSAAGRGMDAFPARGVKIGWSEELKMPDNAIGISLSI